MWNKWLQISTGIYWRPIFNLLEGRYEILLVNAQHMHAIPGHKTASKARFTESEEESDN